MPVRVAVVRGYKMESGRSGVHAERLATDRVEVWQSAEFVVGDILTVPFLSFMELSTEFQLDVVMQAEEVQDPRERVRGCVYASQDKGSAIASSKKSGEASQLQKPTDVPHLCKNLLLRKPIVLGGLHVLPHYQSNHRE